MSLAAPTYDPLALATSRYSMSFDDYLRRGAERMSPHERRDLSVGTNSSGGYTVPPAFLAKVTLGVKRSSAMVRACNVVPTDSGAPMSWPTADDTGNIGAIVAENTAPTTQDITFGQKTVSSFLYTSKLVKGSVQLLQDAGFPLDAWLGVVLGRRIGRATNAHFTVGTGGGTQPTGLIPNAAIGVTGSAGSTTSITYDNVVSMVESVNPEYLEPFDEPGPPEGHVGWMGSAAALSMLRKVKDSQGAPIVTEGRPATVLGYPYMVNNDVPVPAANARSLAFGAFGPAYTVRQVRRDTAVLRLDERFGDALQVGWLGFSAWDGVPDDPAAVRVYVQSAT